ncbi:MAG: exonuclease subunit SbcD [Planctomycetota bacterium]|nr:MAG: exonuclease subunit SbcD [Planctomycetota bacterium]
MKLVHTSDWHLGHTLHGIGREREHEAFLDWLLDRLEEEQADALVVAGDVFETANPSTDAVRRFFTFLAKLRRRLPELDAVVVGGNHDSAGRLDAWAVPLEALGVRVVGGLFLHGQRDLDLERLLVPLRGASGAVEAWLAAVPFLRPSDLPLRPEAEDWLVEGVIEVYRRVLEEARRRRGAGQALLATGHCYMAGGELSELSERKVLRGNQHALPVDALFPEDLAYVALGHLHRAQTVGGRPEVRYSGSPLPLSLAEADYPHQIVVVELEDGQLRGSPRALRVPRSVEVLRVPAKGPLPLGEVLAALRELPEEDPNEPRPYLEVRVALDKPEPTLRQQLEQALEGRHARLVKIGTSFRGDGATLAERDGPRSATELTPDEVLRRRWESRYEGEPPADVLAAFHELVEEVQQEEGKAA